MARNSVFPSLRHEVDRLFDTLVHTAWATPARELAWTPSVDVSEEPERYRVEMDLPGVPYSALSITAVGCTLKVEGVRERSIGVPTERHHVMERAAGRFVRTFHLPEDADVRSIQAQLRDGVLTIEIPRTSGRRNP